MTSATKRKHVVKEMLENLDLPESHQTIVKVLHAPGSNLHEVLTPNGETFLASLPTKFRKNIWIKRGDYVVIEPILEGDKVKGEIVRILYPQHIKIIKEGNVWPHQFQSSTNMLPQVQIPVKDRVEHHGSSAGESSEEEDDFSDIPPNTNRPPEDLITDSEEESSDESEIGE